MKDLIFHEIQPYETEFQTYLLNLFRLIFPDDLRYLSYIEQSMQLESELNPDSIQHHWLITASGNPIGFTVFSYLIGSNIGFGRYVGLDPSRRSLGIGLEIIQATKKQICIDAKKHGNPVPLGYCAEVETLEAAKDESEREINQKRLDYFLKDRGAIELDVKYLEPILIQGHDWNTPALPTAPTPIHLLLFPTSPETTFVDAMTTRKLVEAILFVHYQLDPQDAIAQTILNSIPSQEV